jgi:hypothetical protein
MKEIIKVEAHNESMAYPEVQFLGRNLLSIDEATTNKVHMIAKT